MLTIPSFVVFLYIASAFAVPSPIKRRAGHRRSQPLQAIEATEISNNTSQVQYSYNWAGAVWNESPVRNVFRGSNNCSLVQGYRGRLIPLLALSLPLLLVLLTAPLRSGLALTVIRAQMLSFRLGSTFTMQMA